MMPVIPKLQRIVVRVVDCNVQPLQYVHAFVVIKNM